MIGYVIFGALGVWWVWHTVRCYRGGPCYMHNPQHPDGQADA